VGVTVLLEGGERGGRGGEELCQTVQGSTLKLLKSTWMGCWRQLLLVVSQVRCRTVRLNKAGGQPCKVSMGTACLCLFVTYGWFIMVRVLNRGRRLCMTMPRPLALVHAGTQQFCNAHAQATSTASASASAAASAATPCR
jgi:hypothetical protein